MARRRTTPAPPTDTEGPPRVTTRTKNKDVHPAKEAGVVKRTRAEIRAEKLARTAAREKAQNEKKEKETAAIAEVAAIERKQEARYALDETPRGAASFTVTRGRSSRPNNLTGQKKVAAPNTDSSLPSESDSSSIEFVPEDDETTTEEPGTTDNTTASDVEERKKKTPRKKKDPKEKRLVRTAISQAKEAMEIDDEENFKTPRPAKRTRKSAQLSVRISFRETYMVSF